MLAINSAGHPAVFFESKIMEAENRGPRLPAVCAECGDELVLSRSGHQFYANHLWCRDGFNVRPDWQFDAARPAGLM